MNRLVISFVVFLIFAIFMVGANNSFGGSGELPQEVQKILKEIKENQASGKESPERSPLKEKKGALPAERKTDQPSPSLKLASGKSVDPSLTDDSSPSEQSSRDPLFDAKIRYRNMVENAPKEEASDREIKLPSPDSGDEKFAKEQAARKDLKSEGPAGIKGKARVKQPSPASEKTIQTPGTISAPSQGSCQELTQALDAIASKLNTIHTDINNLKPAK